MESQHLLSNNQYYYLTSQKNKLSSQFNKSQDLKRIKKQIEKSFKTFEIILNSSEVDQSFKDDVFTYSKVTSFLENLIHFSNLNSSNFEENKQLIAEYMIKYGLKYYRFRYNSLGFFTHKATEFETILHDLTSIYSDINNSKSINSKSKNKKSKK